MTVITASEPEAGRRRPVIYAIAVVVLIAWTLLCGSYDWEMGGARHANVELFSSTLAAVVGMIAIARFYSRRDNAFLFIGTGFVGTALLDAYHAMAASPGLSRLIAERLDEVLPWTWTASRMFLAILMLLSWDFARREALDPTDKPEPRRVSGIVGVLAVVTFGAFTFGPLPVAIYPDAWIPRPAELAPGLLFGTALVLHLRSGRWRQDAFQHHLVLSLMAGVTAQVGCMAFSRGVADAHSEGAHWLKAASYAIVFIGLLQEISRSFRTADQAVVLQGFNEQLSARVLEMTRELVARNNDLQNLVEELRAARDEAQAANEAKSRFLATMSHELRTPLTAILGYCELLQEDADATGAVERARDLARIWNAGDHLLKVINDVLDLARIEAGRVELDVELVDVRALIDAAVETLRTTFDSQGNRVLLEFDGPLPPIHTDPIRLRQCLLNVLSNAAKFCEEGVVTIRGGTEIVEGVPWVHLAVTDTGIGMTPDQLARVFVAFEQADGSTSRRYGGTGLGLAITRRLMTLLGGTVDVQSVHGVGSTFAFRIPMRAPDDPTSNPIGIAAASPPA